jgi:type III secretion protein L
MTAALPEARIAPLGRILRAEHVGLYRDAEAALCTAQAAAMELRAAAARDAAAIRAAHIADLEHEVRRETARILADTAAAAQRSLAALPREIAEAIAEGVAKVIGGIDLAEAVARAAQRAMAELADRHAVVVHVNPVAQARTCARLTATGPGVAGPGVRVIADAGLAPDACVIETPAGSVRAGLEDQLAILRAALNAAACDDG